MRWLVLAIAVLPACEPERLPVECSGAGEHMAATIDGARWEPACANVQGSGAGSFVTDLSTNGFDATEETTMRRIVSVNFPNQAPGTLTLPAGTASLTMQHPQTEGGATGTATSGEIVIVTGTPEWSGTFHAVLDDGTVIEDGEFAFHYDL